MFTGIVEETGTLLHIRTEDANQTFQLSCSFIRELKTDQSLSHNGVCLTVVRIEEHFYEVTAVAETLQKSNLGHLKPGDPVNLERCMPANGRFDGHIVQGHVDTTGICREISDENGSWRIWFSFPPEFSDLLVEKGSVCVNGVSLTVAGLTENCFSVVIIPYTWEHTSFHRLQPEDEVNLEFDILGKYIRKMLSRTVSG